MMTMVTLALTDELYERAQRWAAITQQDVSDTLTDVIDLVLTPTSGAIEKAEPIKRLSDAEVLGLTKIQLDEKQGKRLNRLLAKQREGALRPNEQPELLALMQVYDELWIRQSQALAEAVRRGLHKPLES